MAIVTLFKAQTLPSSSRHSTSQTQVVRPLWRRVASTWIVPPVAGRMKVALFDMPRAMLPSGTTAWAVAREARLSASAQ